jgi:integrase
MHLRAAARLMGLPYRSIKSLMRDPEALAQRLLDMPDNPTETHTAAALGLAKDDDLMLSRLFEEFERIKEFDNRNKAPDQLRKWRNPRIKALRNLIDVVDDMPISNFERSHALEFKKSLTAKVQAGEIKAASANKDFIHLSGMWSAISDEKMLELPPVFARLSFRTAETGKRPAFSDNWIKNVLLKDGAFDALNDEARDVFLALINTGCRPSEIANLTADQILLDHNIPHVSIKAEGREVKSRRAIREIPLVGVSLEALRRHPDGFGP